MLWTWWTFQLGCSSRRRSLFAHAGFELGIKVWESEQRHRLAAVEAVVQLAMCSNRVHIVDVSWAHVMFATPPSCGPQLPWRQSFCFLLQLNRSGRGLIPGSSVSWIPDPHSLISACKTCWGMWRMVYCCSSEVNVTHHSWDTSLYYCYLLYYLFMIVFLLFLSDDCLVYLFISESSKRSAEAGSCLFSTPDVEPRW